MVFEMFFFFSLQKGKHHLWRVFLSGAIPRFSFLSPRIVLDAAPRSRSGDGTMSSPRWQCAKLNLSSSERPGERIASAVDASSTPTTADVDAPPSTSFDRGRLYLCSGLRCPRKHERRQASSSLLLSSFSFPRISKQRLLPLPLPLLPPPSLAPRPLPLPAARAARRGTRGRVARQPAPLGPRAGRARPRGAVPGLCRGCRGGRRRGKRRGRLATEVRLRGRRGHARRG